MLGIIVLHYGELAITNRCVASLSNCPIDNSRIVIVNNTCDPKVTESLRSEWSNCDVIHPESNLGFAGGNNRGIQSALDRGADCILLMNNDAELILPSAVLQMVKVLEENKSIGLLGARVIDGYSGSEQNTVFKWPPLTVRERILRSREMGVRQEPVNKLISVAALSGVFLMFRTDALARVGVLDPRFFMYLEDMDFCLRMHKVGYDVMLLDEVAIRHYVTSTRAQSLGSVRLSTYYPNMMYFLRKHGGSLTGKMAVLCAAIGRTFVHWVKGSRQSERRKEWVAFITIIKRTVRNI
jgi:GT2 family glycosyltransferase